MNGDSIGREGCLVIERIALDVDVILIGGTGKSLRLLYFDLDHDSEANDNPSSINDTHLPDTHVSTGHYLLADRGCADLPLSVFG